MSAFPGVSLVSVVINGVSLVSVVINLLFNYYRDHTDSRGDNISVLPDGSSVYVVIKTVISITTKTTRDTAILPSLLSLWFPICE